MKSVFRLAWTLVFLMILPNGAFCKGNEEYRSSGYGFSIHPPAPGLSESKMIQCAIFFMPPTAGFAPNVNIQVQSVDMALEEFDKLSKSQFDAMGFAMIKSDIVGVAEKRFLFYEYTGENQGVKHHYYARAVRRGGKIYLATATALESQWKEVGQELVASVESFGLEASPGE